MTESSFIVKPFLPHTIVKTCAVSCDAQDVISELEEKGIKVLQVKRSKRLPSELSSHADLQLLPLGGNRVAVNKEQTELMNDLSQLGFDIISVDGLEKKYPYDCVLNHLIIKNMLFGNTTVIPKEIISLNIFDLIKVRQGYAKCSSLLIDDDSLITDDISIGKEVSKHIKQTHVLFQNEIALEGYDHGFIGGTCGKLNKDLVCFAGKIPDSSFGNSLRNMLKELKMKYIEIGNSKLKDIGGIIPLLV